MDISKLKNIVQSELNARKVYQDAADVLTHIEQLGQAEKDLSKVVADLKKQRDEAAFHTEKALKDLEDAKKEAKDVSKKAKDKADDLLAKAQEKADFTINAAIQEKATIESKKEAVLAEIEALKEKIDVLTKEKADIDKALTGAKTKLKGFLD